MEDFSDAALKLKVYQLYGPNWTQDIADICEELGGPENNFICSTLIGTTAKLEATNDLEYLTGKAEEPA